MIWNRYFLFKLQLVITPSWSLIVQLRAHSESHSFAIFLRGHSRQSQSILNNQATVWQLQVSNCLIYVFLQKVWFPGFLVCFLSIRRWFFTHAWNLSSAFFPGSGFSGALDRKCCWNPENLREVFFKGKDFDLVNFPKKRKNTFLFVNAESRHDEEVCSLKRGILLTFIDMD